MRTLTSTLTTAQKEGGKVLYKVVLTKTGQTTRTYEQDRILNLKHSEKEDTQISKILLNNADGALTSLNLRGYTATISLGYTTSAGAEYSARAPQIVIAQDCYSTGGRLYCTLFLAGSADRLRADKASVDYKHFVTSTKTVKDMLTEVLSGTPVTEDLIEQQTSGNYDVLLNDLTDGFGQRLLILNRTVSKLAFRLKKVGSPTGNITFWIRATDDLSVYASKVLADASTLTTSYAWYEVTLTTPVLIEDEVYIYVGYESGDHDNYVAGELQLSNVKANEYFFYLGASGSNPWIHWRNYDCAYKYTYAGGGITSFSHCAAYTATYDSEDSLIDSYEPKDAFNIKLGETRLSVVQRLLAYTGCVGRFEDDGEFHVFVPKVETATAWQATHAYSLRDQIIPTVANNYQYICTTAGTSGGSQPAWTTGIGDTINDGTVVWTVSYDYEYVFPSSASKHPFFSKSLRQTLVVPNKVTVKSFPDDDDQYTGNYTSAASYALVPIEDFKEAKLTSNAQGTSIATAIINRLEVDSQKGSATMMVNVGAEIYDFNNFIDSSENDYRVGNIGYININIRPGYFVMEIGLGRVSLKPVVGTRPSLQNRHVEVTTPESKVTWGTVSPIFGEIEDIIDIINEHLTNIFARLNDLETSNIPEITLLEEEQVLIPQVLETGEKIIYIKVILETSTLATGDGQAYVTILDNLLDGMNIIRVAAGVYTVSSSGLPTIQIYNVTDAVDILSTRITIDVSEKNSLTAATPPVIDAANDELKLGDILRIDVDVAGTGTKGLDVAIVCKAPS